jgi:hypothetical protein
MQVNPRNNGLSLARKVGVPYGMEGDLENVNIFPSGRVNTPWKEIPRSDGITSP